MRSTVSETVPGLSTPTRHPLLQGLDAARANLAPGAVLWVAGLAILFAYYYHEPTHAMLGRVAALKEAVGVPFAMVSTMVFGGLLPLLAQRLARPSVARASVREIPFLAVFWAIKGFEVDMLYRLQAVMFGGEVSLVAVVLKVLVDQLVFVPLWATPTIVLGYLWKDSGYRFGRAYRRLGPQWYRRRVVPMILANWGVWFPAVAIIYCLPLPLQVPIQNIVLCLWVLMVMFLTRQRQDA